MLVLTAQNIGGALRLAYGSQFSDAITWVPRIELTSRHQAWQEASLPTDISSPAHFLKKLRLVRLLCCRYSEYGNINIYM